MRGFLRSKALAVVLLLLSSFVIFHSKLFASHAVGIDLTYQCLGGNQYEFTVNFYRDCQGITAPSNAFISISSASCGINTSTSLSRVGFVEVSAICPSQMGSTRCNGGSLPGIQQYTYRGTFTLPANCNDWVISYTECCRNSAITNLQNPGSQNLYVEARLNNLTSLCNNSPFFTTLPTPYLCAGQPFFYNHGAIDIDGDSLVYTLIPPRTAAASNIPYNGGFNATSPMSTSGGFNFNTQTGQMSFTPSNPQQAVVTVRVDEYRNGVLIGSVIRDLQLVVINCNNQLPTASGINGTSGVGGAYNIDVCAGFPLCFDISSNDANSGQTVTLQWNGAIPGATFTSTGTPFPRATFCWQPGPGDIGSHSFSLEVRDNACPIPGLNVYTYTINVTPNPNPPVTASADVRICQGASTPLSASTPASGVTYAWSPASGLSCTNCQNPTASPTVTTVYTVTANYPDGCSGSDQVLVTVNPVPTVSVFPAAATICSGGAITLSATGSGNVTSYQWNPGGLSGATVTVSPTATTTYTVVAYDAYNCPSTPATSVITLNPPPPSPVCNNIYVTPNGTGTGLNQNSPTNLLDALVLGACNSVNIKMAIGTYTIHNSITSFTSYMTLEGGFDPANGWRKTSQPGATTIYRSNLNPDGPPTALRIVAFYLNTAQYFRLQDLTIQTQDANGPAISNYVLHMTACSNYDIVRTRLICGNGGNGASGGNGGDGYAGSNGINGSNGNNDNQNRPGPGGAGGGGGGAGAGTGGAGGIDVNGTGSCCVTGQAGGNGVASFNIRAGGGGGGGATGGEEINAGGRGGNGGGVNGGTGVNGGNGGGGGNPGAAGANGVAGAAGTNGGAGTNGTAPAFTGGFFVPGSAGTNGGDGTGGGGGSGGGGGGGQHCTFCIDGAGNGGGGGGGGGEGASGGEGGTSGGGSIAVYLYNNGATGNFSDCNVTAGTAGFGGTGGTGGTGGNGGTGGTGASASTGEIGRGGNGGAGGRGGNGGTGGSGSPGVSHQVYQDGGQAPATASYNFNFAAQPIITATNIACTGTNITLASASSSNWNYGSGASPGTGTGASTVTQYSTVGRKNITYNGNAYTGFVNMAINNATFVPDITVQGATQVNPTTYRICAGSYVGYYTSSLAVSYDWTLQGVTPTTYTTQNVTGVRYLTPGTYTVTLRVTTDCCGLSQPNTITMIVDDNPNLFLSGVNRYCEGGSTTITASGASSYVWSPNVGISSTTSATVTIVTQTTTTYIVRGYNAAGTCFDVDSVVITVNPNPVPTTSTVAATCGSNGSATVAVTPVGTYSYQWSTTPPQNTATASNVQQGNYQVTVTNASTGCTATAFANIGAVGTPIAYIAGVVNVTCAGASNGSALAAATGGTPPYSYNWGPGFNNAQRTGLAGGQYTVTVTDAGGCSAMAIAYINEPTPVVGQITNSTPASCHNTLDGSITVFVDGGAGGHQVTWSTSPPRNTLTVDNLPPGSYTVTVTDANGCSLTRSAAITSPPPFIITQNSITPTTCGGTNGAITITAIGGTGAITYSLDNGTPQPTGAFTNVPPGAHTILIADANGCDSTYNFTFNTPPPFNLTTSVTPIGCSGGTTGSILATGTGGTGTLQYRIGTGPWGANNNFTLLPAGTYIVWVRDAAGCSLSDTVVLAAPGSLSVTLVQDSVNCNGGNDGSITATGVGGTSPYQFSLNNGTYQTGTSFSSLSAGNYTVTVRDFYNCTATATIAVRQPAAVGATLVQDSVDCNGGNDGSITATGTGGSLPYQYSIDGTTFQPSGNFTGLTAGSYTITVRDLYNCTGTVTIMVRQPNALTMNPVVDDLTCPSNPTGAIATNPSGGSAPYQVSLNNGTFQSSPNFLNLGIGTYTLIARDSKGCLAYDTVVVSSPGGISITLNAASLGCNGSLGSIVATASGGAPGGYFYQLNSGGLQTNGNFNSLSAGFYTVTAYDQLGCFIADTVTIRAAGQIVLTLNADSVLCFGQSNGQITVTNTSGGVGPYTYNINSGAYSAATTFPNLAANTYTIGVRDNSGCNATATATVHSPTQINATAVVDSVNCFGGNDGSFVVNATGGTAPYQYSLTGTGFQPSNSFTGLTAGANNAVTVRDNKGCTSVISVIVNQPAAVALTLTQDSASCHNATDGSITAVASGGSGGYEYSLNGTNFQSSGTFSGLAAGLRTVTVRDLYGCTQTATITVLEPAVLTVTLTATGSSCAGGASGEITATATGGNGINQYSIDGTTFQISNVFSNLSPNTYTVTVVDQNGCRASNTITLQPAAAITVSAVQDSVNCNGASDGEITVTASGGAGTLQYSLDGTTFQPSSTFTGLAAGPYTVTVRDANNCTVTANITVLQPAALTVALVQDSVECFGGNDGSITVTAGGGSNGYQYSLDGTAFQPSNTFAGLAAGPYTVTVRDFRNCTVTDNITVLEPTDLGVATTIANIACSGGTTGSITVNATGGSQPYQYQINGGTLQSSNLFDNLAANTYTINVLDANGCQESVQATILQSTPITVTLVADSLSCNSAGDGEITVTATGGAGTLEYSLNNGAYQTSNIFGSLATGPYTVTVRDASGCTNSATINVHQPAVLALTDVQDSVECNAGNDGSITLTATGGSSGYNYTLNGGTPQISNTFGGLIAGNYNMAVTDFHGCQATVAVTVLQPAALSIALNSTSPVCAGTGGGGITVTAGGGSPGYQYSTDGTTFQASNSFTGLAAGPYTVTVRDDNGCTITDNATITQPTALTLTLQQDSVECSGGNDGGITATAGGGTGVFEYSTDGTTFQTSNTFTGLTAGPYTVTLRDNAGCTVTATIAVLQPAVLNATATVIGISCNSTNDGEINVTGTGGSAPYEFSLNSGTYQSSGAFTGLTANSYTLSVRDANGCTATTNATVQQSPALTLSLAQDSVNCFGGNDGQVIATGSGGSGALQYSLTSGTYQSSGTFTGLAINNYTVTVRDAAGCTATANINVLQPTTLSVTAVQDSANCFGAADGGFTATATGGSAGYEYSLDGVTFQTSPTFMGRAAGAHTVTVRDVHGCTATTNVTVLEPTAITTNVAGTNITCNGVADGTATVVANGGSPAYTYSWNNSGGTGATATGRPAGYAVVTVTDRYNCSRRDSVLITEPTIITVVETIVPLTCTGGNTASISLSASGGTGGYTYLWSNAQTGPSITGLGAGPYSVTVADANGCQWTDSWTIDPPGTITVSAVATGATCFNTPTGSATATVQGATGNVSYAWSTTPAQNTVTANNIPAGPYTVTVTDAGGCSATTTVTIADAPELLATIAGVNPRCFDTNDGSVAVTASGGTGNLRYAWGHSGTSIATVGPLAQGNYNVTITDANNCSVSLSQSLVSPSQLTVSLAADADTVKFGETVQLTATPNSGAVGLSYSWTPSDELSCVDCPNPEAGPLFESAYTYIVRVADINNCEAEAQVRILVDLYDRVLYVPNAFTPNGDGLNDYFHVYGVGLKEVEFQVFDRWGEKMFETTDFTVGWDGFFKSEAMPPGVYVYQVKAIYLDGQEGYKKGSVTLIK